MLNILRTVFGPIQALDQNSGFCATSNANENIGSPFLQYQKQVNFCSNSDEIPMEIITSSVENVVVDPDFEQPIVEYQKRSKSRYRLCRPTRRDRDRFLLLVT